MSKETKVFNDSFEELQKFASTMIIENAGLKNCIDNLNAQIAALETKNDAMLDLLNVIKNNTDLPNNVFIALNDFLDNQD